MVKGKSPGRAQAAKTKSMEEIQEEMLSKLTILTEKVTEMEASLRAANSENEKLRTTLTNQADEIAQLKDSLNESEQYARSWSMRILNIQLQPGSESDTQLVMDTIYQQLLLPILEGAKESKEIHTIPSREALLETAHILPGKGSKKPIIARFFSRYWRSIIFRFRKNYAPREESPANNTRRGAEKSSSRMLYPFYEDLTRATFKQLQAIKAREDVSSAWTVSGVIRLKVKDSDTVYKVSSLWDTVDSLTEE